MLWLGGWLAVVTPACAAAEADTVAAEELFLDRVGPLLKQRCLACHGDDPQKIKGGLDLRSREAMLRGGESGEPAVAPGASGESPLYLAVMREDPAAAMPPKDNDRLAPEDVAAIRSWIDGGAPWPSPRAGKPAKPYTWDAKDGVTVATSGGLSPEWTNRRYKPADLWAYRPLRRPPVPAVQGSTAGDPIDAFLDAARIRLGLEAAPPADPPSTRTSPTNASSASRSPAMRSIPPTPRRSWPWDSCGWGRGS
jgi:mono/diheme cytochrome c family protein